MSLKVKMMTAKEVDSGLLAELHQKCFYRGWFWEEFENYLKNPSIQFWSVSQDQKLVGFLLLMVIIEEGELLTFCVDPACQNQGIGRKLLEAVVETFRMNCGKEILLDVAENNASARNLYDSLGFEPFAIRNQYYRYDNGVFEDAVVMRLKIK